LFQLVLTLAVPLLGVGKNEVEAVEDVNVYLYQCQNHMSKAEHLILEQKITNR
jgi:hypothetical protein